MYVCIPCSKEKAFEFGFKGQNMQGEPEVCCVYMHVCVYGEVC